MIGLFFENKVLKSDLDCWNDVNVSQVISCINQADAECHAVLIQLFNEVLVSGKGDGEKVRLLLKSLTKPDSYLIKLKRKATQIARKGISYFQ
ncbi:hypothetical protein [Psychromonas sp. KJ10-2]|uniref:hypothetical protein n=1 Tax=Psychromonas sp. KJ10-2 TaxID=3391822 RepID=UPI0039B454C2